MSLCASVRRWVLFVLAVFALLPAAQAGRKATPLCVSAEEAARHPNSEMCVTAHVYSVVELADGTRFLDVCPLKMADEECGFLILSLAEDRNEVGPLTRYRDMDVRIRGRVRPLRGRMGIVLSHVRQFSGGPERFKPNPKLLRGFSADTDRMPVRDPNLSASPRARSFMNNRDTIPVPAKK